MTATGNSSPPLSSQFYASTPFVPGNLHTGDIDERDVITQWLSERRGQKVTITVPKKGEKERLVELAANNASMVLQKDSEKIRREEARTIGAVREIRKNFGYPIYCAH